MAVFLLFGKDIKQLKDYGIDKLGFGDYEDDTFIFCTRLDKAAKIRKVFRFATSFFFTKGILSGANEGIWDADIIIDRKED